jgi:hypothetical protein
VVVDTNGATGGDVCTACGGAIPPPMPACPVCDPGLVLSSDPVVPLASKGSRPSGIGRPVSLGGALQVLRERPTIAMPPALAVATTAVGATHTMGRVQLGLMWLLEILLLWAMLLVFVAIGFLLLTFARAFSVAAAINHLAGVDRPLGAAARQVVRRPGSVIAWTAMHGIVGLVHGLALLMRSSAESPATLRYEPGHASMRNSQYVWQVMFGEDAGMARAMDRSAALVRADLPGSRAFSLLAAGIMVVAALAWTLSLQASGFQSGPPTSMWSLAALVTVGLSLWAALADIMDTAAWRRAEGVDGAGSPSTPGTFSARVVRRRQGPA